jgi:hypothetical protein
MGILKGERPTSLGMAQDTGKKRKNLKDQYYTRADIAKMCVEIIKNCVPNFKDHFWLEPSAGKGAFLDAAPSEVEKKGFDIEPRRTDIETADFLNWLPLSTIKPILVFGNPPFGKQASLARAFIRKACQFADIVAFILPRSFMKPSMYSAFPLSFRCLQTTELPLESFEINGQAYSVPCIFQIWKRGSEPRLVTPKIANQGFSYVKHTETHHIVMKRVGFCAGKCSVPSEANPSPHSHYFLRLEDGYIPRIAEIIEKINYISFPNNTTGPRSLSKSEINLVLNGIVSNLLTPSETPMPH